MKLLQNSAQFEFLLKSQFKTLLDTKQQRWELCKTEVQSRMLELSSYFSGDFKQLQRTIKQNTSLQSWFKNRKDNTH